MITYKKHAASVALVMLFAASLLVSVPSSSAVFRQSITDLSAPSSVKAGEAFSVSIRVRYDFTGEGDVRIWARVRDPSTGGDVGTPPIPSAKTVHGAGEGTWDVRLTARNTPGTWRLEAYAFHWDAQGQEVVDSTKGFSVDVRAPEPPAGFDFSIKVSPSMVTMTPREPASPTVTVGLVSGLAQQVSLTYMIPPLAGRDPEISASMSPTKGTPPFTSTVRISTTIQTPPGTYTINMAAVGGGVQKRMSITLTVVAGGQPPPSGFDFSMTAKPDIQSLRPEGSVVYDVDVDLTTGTSETVSLTLSGLPEDATYAFDPPTGLPYFPSTLTVYVPQYTAAGAPMPAGTYTLTVAAEGAGLVRTATTTLVVQAAEATTTQMAETSTQATLTSGPTSVATTQAATETTGSKGGLGERLEGGGIFLGLLIVAIVALAAYYIGKRRKQTSSRPGP